jgi:hypothetical protein
MAKVLTYLCRMHEGTDLPTAWLYASVQFIYLQHEMEYMNRVKNLIRMATAAGEEGSQWTRSECYCTGGSGRQNSDEIKDRAAITHGV